MPSIRPTIVGIALVLSVAIGALVGAPTTAAALPADPATDAAAWLVAQQEADGGFELADFPGFETPDVILALAAHGQTGGSWSTAEGRAAVEAVDTNGDGSGLTALDWVDDFVDAGVTAGVEAKVALLVALPLGYDPAAFDPQGDGATDLTDSIDSIDPALFNSFLFGVMVRTQQAVNIHQDDLQAICEAQHGNGGWSFDAVPDGANGATADSAGFATLALVAAGVATADPVVTAAVDYFETTQQADGSWLSFGSPDPNSAAIAVFGYAAGGKDPASLAHDPFAFIEGEQILTPGADYGRVASPNDGFGVNTFATSQSLQALKAESGPFWFPLTGAAPTRACLPDHPFPDPGMGWNDNAIRWLDDQEVASGYPDGRFKPLNTFNRQQASMWFNNTFPGTMTPAHPFNDVPPGAWWEDGADFVGDPAWPGTQIAQGFPDGSFRGKDPFNRGQAINWLYRAAGAPDVTGLPAHGFGDGQPWFNDALTWAKAHGIVNGFADNTFRPAQQINRGQGAFWLYNLAANPEAWGPGVTLPATIMFTPPAP